MPNYLSLSTINKFVPLARKLGVSAVARGSGGFLSAYRRAGGNPDRLSDQWAKKRDAFVARHMAQVKQKSESLWEDGLPSRRHLALIMWAYSPNASKLSKTTVREDDMRRTREAPRAGNDNPWGIWDATASKWMHDPLVGSHRPDVPAKYPTRDAAERAADKLWRPLNPDRVFTVKRLARTTGGRRVADFNTVDDLADHARREGATHILHIDEEIHIYFRRRDGSYEKAEVWQKDGYWHTQAPGSRTIVRKPPENARPLGGIRETSRRVSAKHRTSETSRLYHVVAINERTGRKEYLTSRPLSHGEAVTMKDRFTPHRDVRIQLEPAVEGQVSESRRMRDQLSLPGSDEHDGEQYAQDQLESDYFRDWIWGQMVDGAKLAPDARIPLETPADFRRLARRMLKDLDFDTRRQHRASLEFFEGFRRRLTDEDTVDWLADELENIEEQIKKPRAPKAGGSAKRKRRRPRSKTK